MTVQLSRKDYWIQFYRKNNFNCLPITRYDETNPNPKGADSRYLADMKTPINQEIKNDENYGVIPMLGKGNCIVDFDDKERFRPFVEKKIKEGFVITESGNGWHFPVKGVIGGIEKMFLYNYKVQDKPLIEVMSPKQYVMGTGSIIFHNVLKKTVTYEAKGGDKIYDAHGQDYNKFIDELCIECTVTGKQLGSGNASSTKYLRDQFLKGIPPSKGTSNHYFHQASLQCNTDKLERVEAIEKIRAIYDKWPEQTRDWYNIEYKINEVYDKNQTVYQGGHRESKTINRSLIASDFLDTRQFFCEGGKGAIIYENKNEFLESVNDTLNKELYQKYPEMEESDFNSILWKIKSGANEMPITNKDEVVFRDVKIDVNTRKISKTNDIADMGFKDYNYLPKTDENKPTEFLKMFDYIPKHELPRLYAGLKAILNGRLDPRITVITGKNRIGKSTMLNILCRVLGKEYAYSVDLNIFLEDRATMGEIAGKRLVVFQDLPEEWKEFSIIKNITGEQELNIRQFNKAPKPTENKIKLFATTNRLPEIKKSAKDSMYSARLSLVHNTKQEKFKEDGSLADRIAKDEGEKIISWIINIPHKDCQYEDSETVRTEWEELSTPEIAYLKANWKPVTFDSKKLLIELIDESKLNIDLDKMALTMKSLGYNVVNNLIKNIEPKQ